MQVADVTAAWSETDSFGLLPVQFTFRTYDIRQMSVGVAGEEGSKAVSTAPVATDLGIDNQKPQLGTQAPKRESTGIGGRPIVLPT